MKNRQITELMQQRVCYFGFILNQIGEKLHSTTLALIRLSFMNYEKMLNLKDHSCSTLLTIVSRSSIKLGQKPGDVPHLFPRKPLISVV